MIENSWSLDDPSFTTGIFSDEELGELAMSASPDIAEDATPWMGAWEATSSVLPTWYMPRVTASHRGTTTKVVIGSVIVGMLIINALGLCITYGVLTFA